MAGFKFIEKLGELISEKVTDLGMEAVTSIVSSTPIGAFLEAEHKFSEIVETHGTNVLDELAKEAIHFKLHGPELLEKVGKLFEQPVEKTGDGKIAAWQKHPWAQSREDWLNHAWEHDWRSQPRDIIGRWIPGRLPYPVAKAPAIGKGAQRSSRRKRRLNRYKRYGRMAARSYKFGGG